jgi:hypothetical protein
MLTPGLRGPATADSTEPTSVVNVEIRPVGRRPLRKKLPLVEAMRLQDAVNAAQPRFRKMEIYVVRTSPETGQKHKMGASFDAARREVRLETDYALHPGDLVVLAQDTSSPLDAVMKAVLGG